MDSASMIQNSWLDLGSISSYAVGPETNLTLSTLSILIISVLILSIYMSFRLSILVGTLKLGIFYVYFAFLSTAGWHVGGDGDHYLLSGLELYHSGVDPLRIWFVGEGNYLLHQKTSNSIYVWLNMLAVYLFGQHFYSPILLNVLFSVITALAVYRISKLIGGSEMYAVLASIFFLFHWTTIPWTTFLNLKEPLVSMLLMLSLMWLIQIKRQPFVSTFGLLFSLLVMLRTRFYIPVLLVVAYFGNYVSIVLHNWYRSHKAPFALLLWSLGFATILFIALVKYGNLVDEFVSLSQMPIGLARMLLSPLPWQVSAEVDFLIVTNTLNWLLLPVTILGGVLLWKSSGAARLLVLLFLVGISFYALVPVLASPRHRYPFQVVLILFQYHAIFSLIKMSYKKNN